MSSISNTTLLLDVLNGGGDTSQNGLWRVNSDGTDLERLSIGGLFSSTYIDAGAYQDPWTNISRNGQFYSVSDWQGNQLAYGLLSGDESDIHPLPLPANTVGAIGWTIV